MIKLQRISTTTNIDKNEDAIVFTHDRQYSRATTAQSNISRKKYRVSNVVRERKNITNETHPNSDLIKSPNTDRFEKNPTSLINKAEEHNKKRPYKSEIHLNKLTMGFLNYDNVKNLYKDDNHKEIPKDPQISSPRLKPKYNPDSDNDLNIFEFFNLQGKSSPFKLEMGMEGGLKRQSIGKVQSVQIFEVFLKIIFYILFFYI